MGIWAITDKTDPQLLSEYNVSSTSLVHNVMFDDDHDERIAMAYYALGFRYVDLTLPTIPIELAAYDKFPRNDSSSNGAWGIYPFDPRVYFYISDRFTGLYVLEYLPTGGTLTGQVRDAVTGDPIDRAEVLDEGDEGQRQQAQALVDSLPS